MCVCVRVGDENAGIIMISYLYFYTYFFYFIYLPFERRIRIYWICVKYTCERPMRYLVMLGIRGKSRNREYVVYKFESGARVRRAALPLHRQRRERGAPAWRQLESASSSSCSNDIERSRSGDSASRSHSNSFSESLRSRLCVPIEGVFSLA